MRFSVSCVMHHNAVAGGPETTERAFVVVVDAVEPQLRVSESHIIKRQRCCLEVSQ